MNAKLACAALAFAFCLSGPAWSADRTIEAKYDLRFWGVTAGHLNFSATINDSAYAARSSQRSIGFIRSLVKKRQDYDSEAQGLVVAGGLKPGAYQHKGGKRGRVVRTEFSGPEVNTVVTPDFSSYGDPPATPAQKREAADPLTNYLTLIAAPGQSEPCPRTAKVFDGRGRYNLVFTPQGREKVSAPAWKGEAFKCQIAYTRVAGFEPPEPGEKMVFDRPMTVWLARMDNGLFAPVRVEAPTTYGVGVVTLTTLKTTGEKPAS